MLIKAAELLPCEFLSWHRALQKYGVHSFLPLASIQHTEKKKKRKGLKQIISPTISRVAMTCCSPVTLSMALPGADTPAASL